MKKLKEIFKFVKENPLETLVLIAIPVIAAIIVQLFIFFMWAAEAAGFKM